MKYGIGIMNIEYKIINLLFKNRLLDLNDKSDDIKFWCRQKMVDINIDNNELWITYNIVKNIDDNILFKEFVDDKYWYAFDYSISHMLSDFNCYIIDRSKF